jgi:sulfoxide reductase heme-binding subunit YedZ
LGVIGGYIAAALGLTFYVRRRIGAARWRKLHRLTIVAYALSVIHTIGAGTDGGWVSYVVLAPAGLIAVLFFQRMLAERRKRRAGATQPGTTASSMPASASSS